MSTVLIVDGDPLMFRAAWKKETVEEALRAWEDLINDLKNASFCYEVKISVFSETNYRKAKANNPLFTKLRDLLVEKELVTVAAAVETDDSVHIWHEEARAKRGE